MKKIFSLLLTITLLLSAVPSVFAAGNAGWNGPSEVRAGDTITLTFYAGGGIYGGSGKLSYDSAQLTLESQSAAIGGSWAVEFSGERFVFYDNSMSSPIADSAKIFTATFRVNANLEPGAQISVTAQGITLSDGKQDISVGSAAYTVTIAEPLSNNCNLAGLSAEGVTISPAFSWDVTDYYASVPFSVSQLDVTAIASDGSAKVAVENPQLIAGDTTLIQITVTAETGRQKQYNLYVTRDQDPNYVPSNDATLASLEVEGFLLSPGFDPQVKQYYVWLPYETETITISASANDGKASAAVAECPALTPGEATDIAVTVTAEDGSEEVYTVTAVRAPAHQDVDAFLHGEPEETVPPTEPATVPEETTPPTQPQEPDHVCEGYDTRELYILCAICAVAGIALGTLITLLLKKRR